MFKSLRCSIVDPNIEKLSQQVLLDYIGDKGSDENETSADEEDEDEEENEGVDADLEDEDRTKAKFSKSSESKPKSKISLSDSMSKISLTEKTLILVSNDIQKTNEYLVEIGSAQTEVINLLREF